MITCKSEPNHYQTTFSNEHVSSSADTTEDKGGNGAGFRPHELLEAAVASCLNIHVRMYADHHNISLKGVSSTVTLDRSLPDEAIFKYSIDLIGAMSEEQQRILLQIAKTCPVRKTLSKIISFQEIHKV